MPIFAAGPKGNLAAVVDDVLGGEDGGYVVRGVCFTGGERQRGRKITERDRAVENGNRRDLFLDCFAV